MQSFSLFVPGDILIILVLSLLYLPYSFVKKIKTDGYIRFTLIFFSAYFLLFYLLSLQWKLSDAQGLFGLCLLPAFALSHWLIPFKKSKTLNKHLFILSVVYLLILLVMVVWHKFSNM